MCGRMQIDIGNIMGGMHPRSIEVQLYSRGAWRGISLTLPVLVLYLLSMLNIKSSPIRALETT